MRAVVVFHGNTEDATVDGIPTHPLNRFLAVGFKHCFAVVRSERFWIRVDGRHGVPLIEVIAGGTYNIAEYYSRLGMTVIGLEQDDRPLRVPLVMNNCVGLVKAALCIRAPFAITPFQLYRHLKESKKWK